MLTRSEAVRRWREDFAPRDASWPDYPARRASWSAFLDCLARSGQISDAQAARWTAPAECYRPGRCRECNGAAPAGRRYCERCHPTRPAGGPIALDWGDAFDQDTRAALHLD